MEYNFTKEWKQPHKVYSIGKLPLTHLFPEGVKASFVISIIVLGLSFLGIIFLSVVKGVDFLNKIFANNWLVILFFLCVGLWVLFSLSWDKKTFWRFVIGRIKFEKQKTIMTEHEHKACYIDKVVSFQRSKKRGWDR